MVLEFARSDEVSVFEKDGILHVKICRARSRNALSLGILDRLREVFTDSRDRTDYRLAVLVGEGDKAFASGGDVIELATVRSPAEARALSEHGKAALNAIRTFPAPVIAGINGLALGGGAELALACDLRFAAAHATIGFIHSRLAISPSWGGAVDLMRLLGFGRGLALLVQNKILSAVEAEAAGIFDEVAPVGADFETALGAFVDGIGRSKPQVLRAAKSLSLQERMFRREELEANETENFVTLWTHDDHWNAVDALSIGRKSNER